MVDFGGGVGQNPKIRQVGVEAGKTIANKIRDGFVDRYLSGSSILDIGYRGYVEGAVPIVPQATGIELDYPEYDGRTLPFDSQTQDAVHASHCLEHIDDYCYALREWHRVLKIGGFMIISVPHKYLYERRNRPPSRWNEDHKRFYTPASLMAEIEEALAPNTYRVRHLIDNDWQYDYSVPLEQHAGGCYEIELVIERIAPPEWALEDPVREDLAPVPEPTAPRRVAVALSLSHLRDVVLAVWNRIPRPVRRLLPRPVRVAAAAALLPPPAD